MTRVIRSTLSVLVLLASWWTASTFSLVNPLFLPDITEYLRNLIAVLSDKSALFDIAATLYRAAAGLLLSVILGVPLGLYFGRNPDIYDYIDFLIDFFRSIPSSALFFLFVLIFGVGDVSKVAVVFYGCFLIMLVAAMYGAQPSREKTDRIKILKTLGATEFQILKHCVLPDSLPQIFSGFRICISLSLVLVVVTEMFLSSTNGLGRRIYDAYLAYEIAEMFVAITLLGAVGYAVNKAAVALERKVLFWTPQGTEK